MKSQLLFHRLKERIELAMLLYILVIMNSGYLPILFWDFPKHKKESLLYIVTETFYDVEHLKDVSEKTWKPIALQMPFILVHQSFALKRLRELGYRTFHTIWDESYDTITDPNERMNAIVNLVLELNSRTDFRDMIDSCRNIVEHNFAMLKMRRPEENMINEFRL